MNWEGDYSGGNQATVAERHQVLGLSMGEDGNH